MRKLQFACFSWFPLYSTQKSRVEAVLTVSDLWELEEIAEQRTGTPHTPKQTKERCSQNITTKLVKHNHRIQNKIVHRKLRKLKKVNESSKKKNQVKRTSRCGIVREFL